MITAGVNKLHRSDQHHLAVTSYQQLCGESGDSMIDTKLLCLINFVLSVSLNHMGFGYLFGVRYVTAPHTRTHTHNGISIGLQYPLIVVSKVISLIDYYMVQITLPQHTCMQLCRERIVTVFYRQRKSHLYPPSSESAQLGRET